MLRFPRDASFPRETEVVHPEAEVEILSSSSWRRRLRAARKGASLDAVVMDLLVREGHKGAAEAFQHESGTNPGVDLSSIEDRSAVRSFVLRGDIESAVELVRSRDAGVLKDLVAGGGNGLLFRLRRQQLLEMIRAGRCV